jgi:hypothetical protein
MNKEHLLPAMCTTPGVDSREHHEATGIDKAGIKAKIRELKRQGDQARPRPIISWCGTCGGRFTT